MRRPEDLTTRELRQIAELAQKWLFLEGQSRQGSGGVGPDVWNLDKEVDCSDFTMDMGELLGDLGMAPDGAEELERKAKHEDFAKFVDDLMKDGAKPRDVALVPVSPATAEALAGTGMVVADEGETMSAYDPDDALLGSLADVQDPNRTGPLAEPGSVRKMLAEFYCWSGGFTPAETTPEQRKAFLKGHDLTPAQEAALWPERKEGGVV